MPVKVVDIRSLSYTGTSWFNTVLACHDDAFALGPPDRFSELWRRDPDKLCLVHGADCPIWPQFCAHYRPEHGFFAQLAEFTGKHAFVLNNPRADGFQREIDADDVECERLYVVRDPRAVTASYARHLGVGIRETIESWTAPALASFVSSYDIDPARILRYEDIRTDPEGSLARAGRIVGLDYEPQALRYWEFEHHLVMANAGLVACIRMHQGLPVSEFPGKSFYAEQVERERADPRGGFSDERWQEAFDEADEQLLTARCADALSRLGYSEPEAFGGLRRAARAGAQRVRTALRRVMRPRAGHDVSLPVVTDTSAFEALRADFASLEEFAATDETLRPAASVLAHYAQGEVLEAYWRHLGAVVARRVPGFERATGLDYGCWYGFSTLVLARLGAGKLVGVDVIESMLAIARRCAEHLRVANVEYRVIEQAPLGPLPLADASVDWVLANDVFSFAHPEAFDHMIREAARVLRAGGRFILSDGNNPHCSAVRRRLLDTYREHEIGDGTPAGPLGSYWRLRRDRLRAAFPELREDELGSLARDTSYLWGEDLIEQGKRLLAGDAAVAPARFEPQVLRVPIHPFDGRSIGSPTDPVELLGRFACNGLAATLWSGDQELGADVRPEALKNIERFTLEGIKQ